MTNFAEQFLDPKIEETFALLPEPARTRLLNLRSLIFKIAAEQNETVSETLKWGQPSYQSASGTPIRLGIPKSGGYALFVHCQTSVISEFRNTFEDAFSYEGNRAVLFQEDDQIDVKKVAVLINSALTYRR